MGSVPKRLTAAAIVLAEEQGYLSLDDDIRKYVPAFLTMVMPLPCGR
jgi:CubicO group peptidase (beta-lactamase class C family)